VSLQRAFASILAIAASLSFVGASCAQSMLGVMPGVVNDPKNFSLRRSILAVGADHICDDIRSRSIPFRFHDEDPVVGRFFPTTCSSRQLPNGDIGIEFSGHGYVWTSMSYRLGFEATAGASYDTDFLLDGSTMYVYFRPRTTAPPMFTTRYVEQSQAGFLTAMLGGGAPGQSLPDRYGAQILAFQLGRGFTVIRDANGGLAYGVGVLPPGQRPPVAYTNLDPDKPVLANERVDLHANQRDFAGPFDVPPGKKLGLVVGVDGAPAIDAIVVPRPIGDAWLATYTHQPATTPPPGPPLLDEAVVAGPMFHRTMDVPAGQYYLVLDNTPTAGRTPPQVSGGADRIVVSYAVQLE
jgi:hypothetical protein